MVDSKAGPTRESRALVLQARSMEIFAQLGISDRALSEGRAVDAVAAGQGPHVLGMVPIGSFGADVSPFPGLWVLEQSKTERLLLDALMEAGGEFGWQHELLDVRFDEAPVTARIGLATEHRRSRRGS